MIAEFDINDTKTIGFCLEGITLVADRKLIKGLAIAEYKLIPSIELKSYAFEENDEAKTWIV